MPAITIVTQTSTKMPYSKLPIQRARKTWLMKAIAALTMRMAKAMTDMRLASPRSSALNSTASIAPEQRPRAQRQALRQEPVSGRCRGKAHALLPVLCQAHSLCKTL